jgi:hypothetical protein
LVQALPLARVLGRVRSTGGATALWAVHPPNLVVDLTLVTCDFAGLVPIGARQSLSRHAPLMRGIPYRGMAGCGNFKTSWTLSDYWAVGLRDDDDRKLERAAR